MNQTLKRAITKLCQETLQNQVQMLLISLRMRINPTPLSGLSSYKTLYGRPFISADLLLDEELNQVVKSVTFLAIKKLGLESLPATTEVLIKTWKEGFLQPCSPLTERSLSSFLTTLIAVKAPGRARWVH